MRDGQPVVAQRALAATLAAGGVALTLTIGGCGRPTSPRSLSIDAGDHALVAVGERLYATHCARCHGADLSGQTNWRQRRPDGRLPAPPHDASGHTWHHPDALLFGMVKEGFMTGVHRAPGYLSDMPAYGEVLDDREIIATLAYIKSTWPAAQRTHQARLSQQAAGD